MALKGQFIHKLYIDYFHANLPSFGDFGCMDICLPLNITKLHCSYIEACARYSVRAPKHYMLTHHQKCDVGEMQDFFINAAH